MTTAVHLDTTALRFYRDAPDNYCHFVLGNLFEVFVGLSESGLIAGDLELTHNNPSNDYEQLYSVFTRHPPRRLAVGPPGARTLALTPTADWSTREAARDLTSYLTAFQPFIMGRLGIEPRAATQVTLIRRNRLASNRYVINDASLTSYLERESATLGLAFEVVDFAGMPFERQVETMSRTAALIGIHGAGLVNALFLPPGAAVIELLPHRRFDALFFRWMGVSKGHRWIRVMEPSWAVPSLYNLFLACTRKGHTRKNRFFRDRNAAYEYASVKRALVHAIPDAPAGVLEIDVRLDAAERSFWRKLALLRTHRKFLLALVCVAVASLWFHASAVFWIAAGLFIALAFCS